MVTVHRIRWWVYVGDADRVRLLDPVRGAHGYDATCSCGWDSDTGGAMKRHIRKLADAHKAS